MTRGASKECEILLKRPATWFIAQVSRLSSIGFAQSRTEHKSLLLAEDRVLSMSLFWTWNRSFPAPNPK